MQLRPGETLLNLQSNWKIEIEKFVELMKPFKHRLLVYGFIRNEKLYPNSTLNLFCNFQKIEIKLN